MLSKNIDFFNLKEDAKAQVIEDIRKIFPNIFANKGFIGGPFVYNVLVPQSEKVKPIWTFRLDCYFPKETKRNKFIKELVNKKLIATNNPTDYNLIGKYNLSIGTIGCYLKSEYQENFNLDHLIYQDDRYKFICYNFIHELEAYSFYKSRILVKSVNLCWQGCDNLRKINDVSTLLAFMEAKYTIDFPNGIRLTPDNDTGYDAIYNGVRQFGFAVVNNDSVGMIFSSCCNFVNKNKEVVLHEIDCIKIEQSKELSSKEKVVQALKDLIVQALKDLIVLIENDDF